MRRYIVLRKILQMNGKALLFNEPTIIEKKIEELTPSEFLGNFSL